MIPNLLSISDFQTHPYYIEQDVDLGNSELDGLIASTQEEVLKALLGNAEYAKFVDDHASGTTWNSTHWQEFVDGVSYTVSGVASSDIPIAWPGIKEVLKYFVFVDWLLRIGEYNTKSGALRADVENSTVRSKTDLAVKIYNLGLDMYGKDWAVLFHQYNFELEALSSFEIVSYYDYFSISGYKTNRSGKIKNLKLANTAYNFLYWYNDRDSTKFNDWEFTIKRAMTISGL